MTSSLRPTKKKTALVSKAMLEGDKEGEQCPAPKFFKVLNSTAGLAKTIALAPASGAKLKRDAVLATLHHGTDNGSDSPSMSAEPTLAGPDAVVVLSLAEIGQCRELEVFDAKTRLQYSLPLLNKAVAPPGAVKSLVTRLVEAGAFPEASCSVALSSLLGAEVQCLHEFEASGFVAYDEQSGGGWTLTAQGMEYLQHHVQLTSPDLFFRVRGLPLKDKSNHELLLALFDQHWKWKRVKELRKAAPYVEGQEKLLCGSGPLIYILE